MSSPTRQTALHSHQLWKDDHMQIHINYPSPDRTKHGHCVKCGKATVRRCIGCIEGLDIDGNHSATFYCNKTCQSEDWDHHKETCQHANYRKRLFRAVRMAENIFFKIREAAYDEPVEDVSLQDNILEVQTPLTVSEDLLFYPFPTHRMTCEDDMRTILGMNGCNDAIDKMLPLLSRCLTGSLVKISESNIRVKQSYRWALFSGHINIPGVERHDILKIELKDGNCYAIDLTGAQYGYYECVVPWKKYETAMVEEIVEDEYEGNTKRFQREKEIKSYTELGKRPTTIASVGAQNSVRDSHVTDRVILAMYDWQIQNRVRYEKIVNGPHAAYLKHAENLAAHVEASVKEYVEFIKKKKTVMELDHSLYWSKGNLRNHDQRPLTTEVTEDIRYCLGYMRLGLLKSTFGDTAKPT